MSQPHQKSEQAARKIRAPKPLVRRKPIARGAAPLRKSAMKSSRKRINPMSKQRIASNARRRVVVAPILERDCLVKQLGAFAVPPCFGDMTPHEPWTQGRGGPRDDARNTVPCCAGHNTWLSQTVDGLRWGEANGLIIHAHQGPAWLEAGGVLAAGGVMA